jgi:hypothetical protein
MQFANPLIAVASFVIGVTVFLGLTTAAALFAGAFAVARAEQVGESVGHRA